MKPLPGTNRHSAARRAFSARLTATLPLTPRSRRSGALGRARLISFLLSATLVSTVGCSNSSNVGDFTFGHCVTPDGAVSMIYPEPNATTVSTNFIQVVVASTSVSNLSTYQTLLSSTTTAVTFSPLKSFTSSLPTPSATPPFASPIYWSSGNPGTTWPLGATVAAYLVSTGCETPQFYLGSFTIVPK